MYQNSNITNRYFRTTAALLLTSVFLLGGALMFFASQYFRNDRQKSLATSVTTGASLIRTSVEENGFINRSSTTAALGLIAQTSDAIVFLAQADGRVMLCSEGTGCTHTTYTIPKTLIRTALEEGVVADAGTLAGIYDSHYYTVGMPVITDAGDLVGLLFASSSTGSLSVFLNDLFSMFLISTGLMLFISSILSVWLSQRLTTPLRVMAEAARSYGKGDFSVRVPVNGDDELAQLALTFNNMAQDLQRTDEGRSALVDNIAHELRTPMTTIKGFVDGVLDGTIPPEQQNHYLQIVSQEVGRLARMTRNMLEVSKLEKGETVQNAHPYDIWQTIVSVALSVEQRIEDKEIRVEGLAPVRTLVLADPDIIHQVVYNLVDNAIKFTPQGGAITFAVTEKQRWVYISVRNSGDGIPEEAIPQVFDRFYKADKSRGIHAEGSGLGLFICKKLVNQSGGDIMVRSKEGEFTEFTFNLPAAEKEKKPKEPRRGRSGEQEVHKDDKP